MEKRPKNRRWLRWTLRFCLGMFLVLFLLLGFWLGEALYNRLVTYPRQVAGMKSLRSLREPVPDTSGWQEYRGILHSHSHLSHDSEVPFEDILQVMKQAGLEFICMSDHTDQGIADFGVQWRGLKDGVLFIPGFEMRNGLMPFGVASQVVLSNQMDTAALARGVVENGGVLFFAHPEEPRQWDLPQLTGFEVYNIHIDFKRFPGGFRKLLPEVLLSLGPYPEQLYFKVFRPPHEFLAKFDDLSRTRHLTAIAGNDCHQNVGYRGFYTTNHTFRIEDTSPEILKEWKPGWISRSTARILFGPLEPGKRLFHFQLDPYERSARFVNTHVLARDLTEPEILEALRAGRVFIGFNMIADSRGFRWTAANGTETKTMGETLQLTRDTVLQASSPLPCRFTVVHDGKPVHHAEGRTLTWKPELPGKYRVEAQVNLAGKWVPWVYTNPIQLL